MNIYKITQIVYLGPENHRHKIRYIQAKRKPTADEVRQKLHTQDTIMVQPAYFDTWKLS